MKFNLVKFKPKVNQVKGLDCLNCGQPQTGNENFCSYCGQKNSTKKLSFGVFVNNIFSGFFSYDSRFWTTFIPLLTKPGKVSRQYIEGKRARFVNPFQLYLNVSIIFFIILGISNKVDDVKIPIDDMVDVSKLGDSIKQENHIKIDSINKETQKGIIDTYTNDSTSAKVIANIGDVVKFAETLESDKEKKPYQYQIKKNPKKPISTWNKLNDFHHYYSEQPKLSNEIALDNLGYEKTFWNKFYYQQVINGNKNYKKIKEDSGKDYVNKLISHVSIALFIFLPVFTLFLMIIYWRKKFTYMEHLVFVFNTQTVFFLLLSIFLLIGLVVEIENVAGVFLLLFLIYLYKAMRNFYQQRRFKTFVKYILLNSYYLFLAFVGFIIVAVISFTAS
ncbi:MULTISPECIES: DUF3667 domain-containing protein [Flavobacteriaceae]|uniref:DUF3667 domain-containing protein n=2 Tax=Flavobacteriaceae TaxID=49546 RepID=A0A4Y8ASH0_9FLAO|nr:MULTISPECIES: DUF3667 domain-containing protein [Flavobacteriaceae]TEW73618.1 DUF3667 domain-containing protein [Gramella jeungdoensis]GGK36146.1 hypothetical protein GCM10007963_00230 [Lutibacter litoralis]